MTGLAASTIGLVRNRSGGFSPLRALALAFAIVPGVRLALLYATNSLGSRPITELIHGTGQWMVCFLLLSLTVTPVRAVLDWPAVVQLRRMLGVTAACYGVAHLLLYCVDQKWHLLTVVSEIALRFYLTIGFVALTGLLVLAITSTDGWQMSLGRRWKQLHRIVFVIAVLGLWHYALQSKADVSDAVFAAGVFVWLVTWRRVRRRWQARLALLPALAVAASLATAVIEALWYGIATKASGWDVLAANIDPDAGVRPAMSVLITGLVVWLVVAVRRLVRRIASRRRVREVAAGT